MGAAKNPCSTLFASHWLSVLIQIIQNTVACVRQSVKFYRVDFGRPQARSCGSLAGRKSPMLEHESTHEMAKAGDEIDWALTEGKSERLGNEGTPSKKEKHCC